MCKEKTCCFSGHRQLPSDRKTLIRIKDRVASEIKRLTENGFSVFISGCAVGFDTLCALEVLAARQSGAAVKLVCAVPFRGQADRFTAFDKKVYERIIAAGDEVVYLSDKYYPGSFAARNKYMVDRSDALIYFLEDMRSGTAQTVGFARKKGIELIRIC